MLSFCNEVCARAFCAGPPAGAPVAAPEDRCGHCGSAPPRRRPPPLGHEARALFVELHRVTRGGGPELEAALRALDGKSVQALRIVVRELESRQSELRSKARRLGLGGFL